MSQRAAVKRLERRLKPKRKEYLALYTGDNAPGVYYQSMNDFYKALYDGEPVATLTEQQYQELTDTHEVLLVRFVSGEIKV